MFIKTILRGRRGRVCMITVHSVPIITKVVSSNPVHGKVHSIQHYVIKFVSDRPDFTRTTKKRKSAKSEVLNIL